MYFNNQRSQYCLICHKPVRKIPSLYHLIHQVCICPGCINKLEFIHYHGSFEGIPIHIIYRYNDFFKKLLFQYKGQYDYALKDVFLQLDYSRLKRKYKHFSIVIAPSDKETSKIRGFIPNKEIVSLFASDIFMGLYKNKPHKQALLDFKERGSIKNVIEMKGGEKLYHKKVLLFDDVITSGSTLSKCLELVRDKHPEEIEILILATKVFDKINK